MLILSGWLRKKIRLILLLLVITGILVFAVISHSQTNDISNSEDIRLNKEKKSMLDEETIDHLKSLGYAT